MINCLSTKNSNWVILLSKNNLLAESVAKCVPANLQLHVTSECERECENGRLPLVLIDPLFAPEPNVVKAICAIIDGGSPVALLNTAEEQARILLLKRPEIAGVFHPHCSNESLKKGIVALLDGGQWLPRSLMGFLIGRYRTMMEPHDSVESLTVREKQVLTLAAEGFSNAAIADRLNLSCHTIKSHIHNALSKMGASNRAHGAVLVIGHTRALAG